jgi:gluconokinase
MGVSGSGKSTVGRLLAERLGREYAEADDFHPEGNLAKMAAGQPLDDADRWPWLHTIAAWIDERHATGRPAVITCSALKRSYRELLTAGRPAVRLVYLRGSRELIAARLAERTGHFFPQKLLDSQFDALEEPGTDEAPVVVEVEVGPERIVRQVLRELSEPVTEPPSGGGAAADRAAP